MYRSKLESLSRLELAQMEPPTLLFTKGKLRALPKNIWQVLKGVTVKRSSLVWFSYRIMAKKFYSIVSKGRINNTFTLLIH